MAAPKFSLDSALKILEFAAKEANKDLNIHWKTGASGGWSVSFGSHEKRTYEHVSWADERDDALKSALERIETRKTEKGAMGNPRKGI